jgi:tRNA(Ile)-lysidine synthase
MRQDPFPLGDLWKGGIGRELDARLEREIGAPIAVAFSGGGDSLALLLAARSWAAGAGRSLVAFTVDHGLQAESRRWASWCAERAAELGVPHQTLRWEGEKPRTGLAAAARAARHALIADAARAAGARVILFGHTADDVLEARLMREGGVRMASPRPWSPSPVWPQGRGLFLLRPLIDVRRAAIREALFAAGETWIEDPANADARHPRVRARASLASRVLEPVAEPGAPDLASFLPAVRIGRAGEVSLVAAILADAPGAARFLAAVIVCVAGGETPPRGPALERLLERIGGEVSATLAGARIIARDGRVVIAREAGDSRARAAPALTLEPGKTHVHDGRYEVRALASGLTSRPLAGLAARLDRDTRSRLAAVPAVARASLPALADAAGAVSCPTLVPDSRVDLHCLVADRLAGACGAIRSEGEIGDRAGLSALPREGGPSGVQLDALQAGLTPRGQTKKPGSPLSRG